MLKLRLAKIEDAAGVLTAHVESVRTLCSADYTLEQITAWVADKKAENYLPAIH